MKTHIYQAMIFLVLSGSLIAGDNDERNDVYQRIRILSESTINSLMPSCHLKKTTTDTSYQQESLSDYACGSELTNVITVLDPIIDSCVENNSISQSCIALTEEYKRLLKKQAERGLQITLNAY